jgi:hypothetical protein
MSVSVVVLAARNRARSGTVASVTWKRLRPTQAAERTAQEVTNVHDKQIDAEQRGYTMVITL